MPHTVEKDRKRGITCKKELPDSNLYTGLLLDPQHHSLLLCAIFEFSSCPCWVQLQCFNTTNSKSCL